MTTQGPNLIFPIWPCLTNPCSLLISVLLQGKGIIASYASGRFTTSATATLEMYVCLCICINECKYVRIYVFMDIWVCVCYSLVC